MHLVIFDLDGTLFKTETVDVVAINKALESNGYNSRDKSEILPLIGMTLKEVCVSLTHTNETKILNKLQEDIIKFEKNEIYKHGRLYEDVLEGLVYLKRLGYTLCICSNGGKEYITEITNKFQFNDIFDDISCNDCQLTKSQRVGQLKDKYNANNFIMVGDRMSDIEAAKVNNGISIGVTYGFGKDEALSADYVANNFIDVLDVIKEILDKDDFVCYN